METLVQLVSAPMGLGMQVVIRSENITEMLAPGRIMDFNDDSFDCAVVRIITIVKSGWIEAMPPISKMGKHSYRTRRRFTQVVGDQGAYRLFDGLVGIAEMVPAPQVRNVDPVGRP
jgi:hypothetical protein